jgi:hypothetical protein
MSEFIGTCVVYVEVDLGTKKGGGDKRGYMGERVITCRSSGKHEDDGIFTKHVNTLNQAIVKHEPCALTMRARCPRWLDFRGEGLLLSSIALSSATSLRRIQLQCVCVDGLVNLTNLNLSDVHLERCLFSGNDLLVQLRKFEGLAKLSISYMDLSNEDLQGGFSPCISEMRLMAVNVKDFTGACWPDTINSLTLSKNEIDDIKTLNGLSRCLPHLSLECNKITTIDGFDVPPGLERIDLGSNRLGSINFRIFQRSRIKRIHLDCNNIETMFLDGLPATIKYVTARGNPLRDYCMRYDAIRRVPYVNVDVSADHMSGASRLAFEALTCSGIERLPVLRHWSIAVILYRASGDSLIGKLPRDLRRLLITDYMKSPSF